MLFTETTSNQPLTASLLGRIVEERMSSQIPAAKINTASPEIKLPEQTRSAPKVSVEDMIKQSAKKTALPAGFVTSSGNVYAYVNSVSTIRFTIDSGDEFGQLHERTICVFISPEDTAAHDAASLNEYHIAYEEITESGETKYKYISDSSQLPFDAELVLVKNAKKNFHCIPASFKPEVGKIPVEKWSNKDITGTHTYIGQKVAHIIATRSAAMLRMKSTGAKAGKPENYFSELEKLVRG